MPHQNETQRQKILRVLATQQDWMTRAKLIQAVGIEKGYAAIIGAADGAPATGTLRHKGWVDAKRESGRVSYRLTEMARASISKTIDKISNDVELNIQQKAVTHDLARRVMPQKIETTMEQAVEEASATDLAAFDPEDVKEGKEYLERSIAVRRGQQKFRTSLLAAYGRECCVSGCRVEPILEAAHIYPYEGASTNHISNGLLLRSDIHTLFDLGLIRIDPKTQRVEVHPLALIDPAYREIHGKVIKLAFPDQSSKAIAHHRASHEHLWLPL